MLKARGLPEKYFSKKSGSEGGSRRPIGGLTMGADPIVVAVSVVSGELNGFLVRKADKQHGTGQRIEGFREKGARVVIVDDVCTTGASTIQAIEAAREFGFEVVGVMCLVEREEAQGRPNVEKAAAPAPFISIFTANDVRKQHILQTDDTEPSIFAVAAACEVCGRPAVTNNPRSLCAAHKVVTVKQANRQTTMRPTTDYDSDSGMDRPRRALHRSDEAADGRNLCHLQDARAGGGRNPQHGGARSAGDRRGRGHGHCAGREQFQGRVHGRSQTRLRSDLRRHRQDAAHGGESFLGDPAHAGKIRAHPHPAHSADQAEL